MNKIQAIIYCRQKQSFYVETSTKTRGPFDTFGELLKNVNTTVEDIPITAVSYY